MLCYVVLCRLLQEASKYIVRKLSEAKRKVMEQSRRMDAILMTESGGLSALIELAERCEKWEEAGDIMKQLDQRSKFGYVMRVRDWFQVLLPGLIIESSSSSSKSSPSSPSSQAGIGSGSGSGEEKEAKGDEEDEDGGGEKERRHEKAMEQVRGAEERGYLVDGSIRADLEDILNCSDEQIMEQWQGEEKAEEEEEDTGMGQRGGMEVMRLVKEMEVG